MILLKKAILLHRGTETPVLCPTDQASWDALSKLKAVDTKMSSVVYRVEAKRARSPKQHRKFFAMLNLIFKAQLPTFRNMDHLRMALLIEAGYCEPRHLLTGDVVNVAKSMSFHSMGHDEFTKLFDDVVDVACAQFNLDKELLLNEMPKYATETTPETAEQSSTDDAGEAGTTSELPAGGNPAGDQHPKFQREATAHER